MHEQSVVESLAMLYAKRKWKFIYSPQTIDHLETKIPLNFAKIIGTRHLQEIRLDGKDERDEFSMKATFNKNKSQ